MSRIFNIISLLLLCSVLSAQEVKPEVKAAEKSDSVVVQSEAVQANEKSLLWVISGNGLDKPSYLYGTIHMIGKEDFFMTDATKTAFSECDRVTFEINMEDMNDMTVLFSLLGNLMMEGGKSLKDLISEEDYKLVKKHFDELGMPLMLFERMKPMFLTTFADADLAKGGMGGGGDIVSYEMEFMEMAKTEEKEVGGLETIEFQMSIFDSIPYEAQAQMLVEGIKAEKDTTQEEGEFDKMVEMYKQQDIYAMQTMFDSEEADEGIGQYEQILLVNRNINWIPIMAKMMEEKQTFFAVGAGHLGGEKGVIRLLKDQGYEVKPVF